MTSDVHENTNHESRGISRRSIMKAGAWSAPVVALAVATPLAAASINNVDTQLGVSNSGSLTVGSNTVGGSVNGSFAGNATVSNTGPGWDIDDATVSYQLSGPITPHKFRFGGVEITGSTITSGAYTWAVVSNIDNYLELALLSPKPIVVPANGSTVLPYPSVTYVTTLTGAASSGNRVQAVANATVYSAGDSLYNGNIKRYPA